MTKEKLINASKELFLKYGIKSVSMDDIARHLGVSKKTIYKEVLNKKILVEEVFLDHVKFEEETIASIIKHSDNAIDELIQIAEFVLAFLKIMKPSLTYDLRKYHKDTWDLMESQHFQFLSDTIKNNLKRGIKEKLFRKKMDINVVSLIYMLKNKYIILNPMEVQTEYDLATVYKVIISQHLYSVVNKESFDILEQYLKKLNL